MKFSQIEYKRPDVAAVLKDIDFYIDQFELAENANEQYGFYREAHDSISTIDTQYAIARIRNRIDTTNEFYEKECAYFGERMPELNQKLKRLTSLVLSSKFRPELENLIGKIHFKAFEFSEKTYSAKILPDLQEENKLIQEYVTVMSSLMVEFEGKEITISQLASYKESLDDDIRIKAFIAEGNCYDTVNDILDEIFDKLVKCRTRQAHKLGFEDYTQLAYIQRNRICYSIDDIALLKTQIIKELIPCVEKIKQTRCNRLGFSNLSFNDLALTFKDSSPKLIVHGEELMQCGKKMYYQMSEEMSEFYDMLMENELYDIQSKKGKAQGGFCSYLKDYNYPFIFANFNGTSSDAYVVFHEAGHAFARYVTQKKFGSSNDALYKMDLSECHSMIMEFLTMQWYDMFFGEDAEKYKVAHVENALMFIPYACQVDEFQEQIYKNTDLSKEERNKLWLEIEQKFRPNIDYKDIPFYKNGAGWKRQQHIFRTPFYYIEYCLAQIVALQFFVKSLENYDETLKLYIKLVKLGGSKTFIETCKEIGIISPFEVKEDINVFNEVMGWLDKNNL